MTVMTNNSINTSTNDFATRSEVNACLQVSANLVDVDDPAVANNNLFVNGSSTPTPTANAFVLDGTYLGSHVNLSNAGVAYTVQIPQGSVGFITLWNAEPSVNATVSPSSGNIDGNATYVLNARQSVTFYTDGASYSTFGSSIGANPALTNQNLFANSIITPTFTTNATTLTSTSYGATVQLVNGTTAGTVNLPAAVTGKIITLVNVNGSGALMTIDPNAAETIAGQATLVMGVLDVIKIAGLTGTGWLLVDSWIQPANVLVNLNADQTLANASATKVTLDTESFDIGGFFDAASNYRFLPKLPGKYQVSATVSLDPTGIVTLTTFTASLYKNGSAILAPVVQISTVATSNTTLTISALVAMNGSSDYLEIFATQSNATTTSFKVVGGATKTSFSATRASII